MPQPHPARVRGIMSCGKARPMGSVTIILGIAWCAAAALIIALAVPLALRKVPPNPLYGARFRASMASADAWYAINRYAGVRMIAWACPMLALGVALLVAAPPLTPAIATTLGFAPLAFVLIPVAQTFRFGKRYARPLP